MYPSRKRHAGSFSSLQTVGSSQTFITVQDQQGIDRQFPVNDLQMSQVLSILTPAQQQIPPQMQPGFGSVSSFGSGQSAASSQTSQASGLNMPAARYFFSKTMVVLKTEYFH